MMIKMEHGFKNEENARQLVQKELAVMKDEIKNLKMGRGSTGRGVVLVSGTHARPPLASRWNDTFIPRKMEFKGWVTDCSESTLQGVTDEEIMKFLNDLERMVPQQAQKWIDCDQTKKEQGTWRGNNGKHVVQA